MYTATSTRAPRWTPLIAAGIILAACGSTADTTSRPTTTASPAITAPLLTRPASPDDLFAALEAAWTAGDSAELAKLVPASADELLADGPAESVTMVNRADCAPDASGVGRCELLVVVDGFGLIYDMYFGPTPDGGLLIDRVEFGGDAG